MILRSSTKSEHLSALARKRVVFSVLAGVNLLKDYKGVMRKENNVTMCAPKQKGSPLDFAHQNDQSDIVAK